MWGGGGGAIETIRLRDIDNRTLLTELYHVRSSRHVAPARMGGGPFREFGRDQTAARSRLSPIS